MRLKAHLLAQPARPDGRDPAKITGRFRADFRLAITMVSAPAAQQPCSWDLDCPTPASGALGSHYLQHATPMVVRLFISQ